MSREWRGWSSRRVQSPTEGHSRSAGSKHTGHALSKSSNWTGSLEKQTLNRRTTVHSSVPFTQRRGEQEEGQRPQLRQHFPGGKDLSVRFEVG